MDSGPSEEDRLLQNFSPTDDEDGYLPVRKRRAALASILMCQFSTWVTYTIIVTWIPRTFKVATIISANEKIDHMIAEHFIVLYCLAIVAGVVMDSCIRKTHMLLTGTVLVMLGNTALILYSALRFNPMSLSSEEENLYVVNLLLVGVTIMTSLINVALPTLGGDQIPVLSDVRSFYAAFFFCHTLGKFVACLPFIPYLYTFPEVPPMKVWYILAAIFTFLNVSLVLLVVGCKWTREVSTHRSIITNPFRVCRQAFQRRGERRVREGLLSPAKRSNGGDFPDGLVNEIIGVASFGLALFCLLPVTFADTLPTIPFEVKYGCLLSRNGKTDIDMLANETKMPLISQYSPALNTVHVYSELTYSATCLLAIPAVHGLCLYLTKKGYPPSILHRFIAGHLLAILSGVLNLLLFKFSDLSRVCTIFAFFSGPQVLSGICAAIILTTGYELTLISAPRSLQGIAMGMYFLMYGISYAISMVVITAIKPDNQIVPGSVSLGSCVLGLILLIVMEKKCHLGLNRH